ncbi:MAG TPA: hypothetical protein VGQ52_08545 [Gemmatimonadaceae bacterium]|nr:hypothetical protein [Gemmatimonadaceae bacterium]
MTTPYRRAFVSMAATMTIALALGACVRPLPPRPEVVSLSDDRPLTFRFDNEGREHVHVYLIGVARQWLLGRVEPGAIATLRIPADAIEESAAFVRLAVLTGERVTLQASSHPRATLTIAQPVSAVLAQRWRFSEGNLTSLTRQEFP